MRRRSVANWPRFAPASITQLISRFASTVLSCMYSRNRSRWPDGNETPHSIAPSARCLITALSTRFPAAATVVANSSHRAQRDPVRPRVKPFPTQRQRTRIVVHVGDVRWKRSHATCAHPRAQQLELVAPPSIADRALPIHLPVGEAGERHRFEGEARVGAGNDALVVEAVSLWVEVPLHERADQAVVAFELERNANLLCAQPLHERPAQRVQIRDEAVLLDDLA